MLWLLHYLESKGKITSIFRINIITILFQGSCPCVQLKKCIYIKSQKLKTHFTMFTIISSLLICADSKLSTPIISSLQASLSFSHIPSFVSDYSIPISSLTSIVFSPLPVLFLPLPVPLSLLKQNCFHHNLNIIPTKIGKVTSLKVVQLRLLHCW